MGREDWNKASFKRKQIKMEMITGMISMSIALSLMLLLSPLVRNQALLKDFIVVSVEKYCSLRKKFPLWGIT